METVGLLPCAGKGTRLGMPFSKEMFPDVHNENYRPVIMYTIDAMKRAGIKHIIITVNPNKTDLLNYLGNGKQFGIDLTVCIHPEAKSLPQSLNEAYHIIKDKKVVFAMPDTVIEPRDFLKKALEAHNKNHNSDVTLGCFKTDNPTSVSVVEFDGELITNVIEKPKETNLEYMWGMMVWNPVFSKILNEFCLTIKHREGAKELYLSDALFPLIEKNKVFSFIHENSSYRDLGTFKELNQWSKLIQAN
ncbi:NTP transferase domain-containing protein [Bacillus sp. MM2020_1]|nr:NTP transferase domain-containing protein [Bacillus sp. MM2020_1]